MVQIQLELDNEADAIVAYFKAKESFKTKGEAINYLLKLKACDLQ